MQHTKSQRILHALQQLEQFAPYRSESEDQVLHVLTGALVSAYTDPNAEDSEMIKIQFPGGPEHEVIGIMYLNLQILESAAHELHKNTEYDSLIARRAEELSQHLLQKHDLD